VTHPPGLGRVQTALKRTALRRKLRAASAGELDAVKLIFDDRELDPLSVVAEVARPLPKGSVRLHRLTTALAASGSLAEILDALAATDARGRERSARAAGILRLDPATPWLVELLGAREVRVRVAACRALGRIGGAAATESLIAALRARRLPISRLVIELARAAPDLYLESNLNLRKNAAVRPALVAALALRNRRTALSTMRRLVVSGSQRERTYACRALAWLRDPSSADYVAQALGHRSWRVRRAAARTLGQLGAAAQVPALEQTLQDPNQQTRAAAAYALRVLTPEGAA
jgi:HEAT repeat protein